MEQVLSAIDDAARAIADGGLVVVPTETVYGIVAKPEPDTVARIFALKDRPQDKSIQLLVPGAEWLDRVGHPSADARLLGAAFWPGPLTLVVWARTDAPPGVVFERTIGVRVPAHPIAQDLLARCGPLAASSANASGEPTPPTVDGVRSVFGAAVQMYLDGGPAPGTGSTVLDVTGERAVVLREGPITAEMLKGVLGGRFEGV